MEKNILQEDDSSSEITEIHLRPNLKVQTLIDKIYKVSGHKMLFLHHNRKPVAVHVTLSFLSVKKVEGVVKVGKNISTKEIAEQIEKLLGVEVLFYP